MPNAPRILRTEKGTPIKRARIGVGKDMGGILYLHRDYEPLLPNQPALAHAKRTLDAQHPGFQYNVVKAEKSGRHTFFNSPDFDTEHEPTGGQYVVTEGGRSAPGATGQLWHHKWMFVGDDYKGFNVDDSFDRSRRWLQIPGINFNHIGNPAIWKTKYVPRIPVR